MINNETLSQLKVIYPTSPLTVEQLFPTCWVLHGVARRNLAQHLWFLRRYGKEAPRACLRHAHWVGVYPSKPK